MNVFKSPIEWLKETIQELIDGFANMAFDWIELFMLAPTDFNKYPAVNQVYDFTFTLATSLSIVFIAWALLRMIFNQFAGVQSKSIPEILSKSVLAFILAAAAPWILNNVLLKLNNMMVQYFLDQGLDTKTLQTFIVIPTNANLAFFLVVAAIVLLFILLGLQYIQRLGEFMLLLVTSPIAAMSLITDDFDIWSVWWREAISVVFTQAFQVAMLWMILNMFTGTEKLSDYVLALGLIVLVIRGPKYFRQFIYSTGSGKMAVGMAGGMAKTTMYRYAATKLVTK